MEYKKGWNYDPQYKDLGYSTEDWENEDKVISHMSGGRFVLDSGIGGLDNRVSLSEYFLDWTNPTLEESSAFELEFGTPYPSKELIDLLPEVKRRRVSLDLS